LHAHYVSAPPYLHTLSYTTLFRSLVAKTVTVFSPGVCSFVVTSGFKVNVPGAKLNCSGPDAVRVTPSIFTAVTAARQAALSVKLDRKSTRLNSSHVKISYAVFCLK